MKYLLLILCASWAAEAASLNYSGTTPVQDSGLGSQQTLLTSSGSGCVGWSGGADVVGGALCESWSGILGPTNLNQTRTYAVSELAETIAGLRIVFNPAETGARPSINLEQLILMIFDDQGGSPLLTAALPAPLYIENAGTGTGTAGFVFVLGLTAEEYNLVNFPANRVGLAFTTTGHDGAAETFFHLSAGENSDPTAVPEPGSGGYLLLAGILGAIYAFRRCVKMASKQAAPVIANRCLPESQRGLGSGLF